MHNQNCRPNKEDWRNSTELYTIRLARSNYVLTEWDLNCNIDIDTLTYKHWTDPELKELSHQGNRLEYSNASDGVRYILTVLIERNKLDVSCSCNRKVQQLCHHAYYGLFHLIDKYGIYYFQSKL